jgi:1,4-dihydroxy-2-naphthoate octaprenyltransferase
MQNQINPRLIFTKQRFPVFIILVAIDTISLYLVLTHQISGSAFSGIIVVCITVGLLYVRFLRRRAKRKQVSEQASTSTSKQV